MFAEQACMLVATQSVLVIRATTLPSHSAGPAAKRTAAIIALFVSEKIASGAAHQPDYQS
jgi:hypothetical protein